MSSVSGRERRRLYRPYDEQIRWQGLFVQELLKRPGTSGILAARVQPRYAELLRWAGGGAGGYLPTSQYARARLARLTAAANDPNRRDRKRCRKQVVRELAEWRVYDVVLASYPYYRIRGDAEESGWELASRLVAELESFTRDTLGCCWEGMFPAMCLYRHMLETLWRMTDGCARVFGAPFGFQHKHYPLHHDGAMPFVERNPKLRIILHPGDNPDDFRTDAHQRLDHILDEMQAEAKSTYRHMNPSTEKRRQQDAKDLAALCVDGWQPIGEAHKKRLKRFAAFVGIDYPGQKLTGKAA